MNKKKSREKPKKNYVLLPLFERLPKGQDGLTSLKHIETFTSALLKEQQHNDYLKAAQREASLARQCLQEGEIDNAVFYALGAMRALSLFEVKAGQKEFLSGHISKVGSNDGKESRSRLSIERKRAWQTASDSMGPYTKKCSRALDISKKFEGTEYAGKPTYIEKCIK